MTEAEATVLLGRYSRAEISAVQLRRELGGITYGDVLIALARHNLPLPRTPQAGSKEALPERGRYSFRVLRDHSRFTLCA